MVTFLLGHGAKPDIEDRFGITPLQEATSSGHDDIVSLLQECLYEPVQLGRNLP